MTNKKNVFIIIINNDHVDKTMKNLKKMNLKYFPGNMQIRIIIIIKIMII